MASHIQHMQKGGSVPLVIFMVITEILKAFAKGLYYFIIYVGIPLFIVGCILSFGFSIGFIICIIGGAYLYNKYLHTLMYK